MKYYTIEVECGVYDSGAWLDIDECQFAHEPWNTHEDTWCKGDEVYRARRRLLRKYLMAKRYSYLSDADRKEKRAEDDDEVDRLLRWADWCWRVAQKLEENER